MEFRENFEECARREVKEEAGLEVANIKPAVFTNDIFKEENKHYITLFFTADYISGEAKI